MPFNLNSSDIVALFAIVMFLSILLSFLTTFIYYLKVVRKIDSIIYAYDIDRDQFDLGYARFILYKKAVFQPDFFATERRKKNIFDPKILEGKITKNDKKIMKWHTYFFRFSLIMMIITFTIQDLIAP